MVEWSHGCKPVWCPERHKGPACVWVTLAARRCCARFWRTQMRSRGRAAGHARANRTTPTVLRSMTSQHWQLRTHNCFRSPELHTPVSTKSESSTTPRRLASSMAASMPNGSDVKPTAADACGQGGQAGVNPGCPTGGSLLRTCRLSTPSKHNGHICHGQALPRRPVNAHVHVSRHSSAKVYVP